MCRKVVAQTVCRVYKRVVKRLCISCMIHVL